MKPPNQNALNQYFYMRGNRKLIWKMKKQKVLAAVTIKIEKGIALVCAAF